MSLKIQHVDLVHFCHSDYGFTDHPVICRELHRRYIDIAIDAVLATEGKPAEAQFCWTAEVTRAVKDWWEKTTPARRDDFRRALATGRLDVAAMPMHQTPTLSARQWKKVVNWLPEEAWNACKPVVGIQNDVNGMPRVGAAMMLDRGVKYLFFGINADSGGAPFKRPTAFWWKMPDGRRIFVWLGEAYYNGRAWFEPDMWRRGPVVESADTRYRPPRAGEIFASDEASVRKAHAHLVKKLGEEESKGYAFPSLVLSIVNEWRMDSDAPFPPLADFVAAWQKLGLKPSLRLTTVSTALKKMESEIGAAIPEHAGEWPDWWANGAASGPREVTASRMAKRAAMAAESPIWGEMAGDDGIMLERIYEDLCLWDEHTWGHASSIALPDQLSCIGQYVEKSGFAYRPLAEAQWLLGRRVRRKLASAEEGLYVTNTTMQAWSGWITMPTTCLRGAFRSVVDSKTGKTAPIEARNGFRPFERPKDPSEASNEIRSVTFADNYPGTVSRFWIEQLPAGETRRFALSTESPELRTPEVSEEDWPKTVTPHGMTQPLFLEGFGDFLSVGVRGFTPRWVAKEAFEIEDNVDRQRRRKEILSEIPAIPVGKAAVERGASTTTYTQSLRHPRLEWATRRLEIWHNEARARLTLKFSRISSDDPEVFFIAFPLPCDGTLPRASNGGMPFTPYTDQIPGTCRDFFAIDSSVSYDTPNGQWLWVSRDAPLVTFGGQHVLEKCSAAPRETGRIMSILLDTRWYTNFVANPDGVMEFQFELKWSSSAESATVNNEWADTLVAEPQVIIVPGGKDEPILARYLYQHG